MLLSASTVLCSDDQTLTAPLQEAWSVAMAAAGAVEESSQQARARLEASATALQSLASMLQDQQQVQQALEQLQQQEAACRQSVEAVEQQAQVRLGMFV